jgi:hypothetical protein
MVCLRVLARTGRALCRLSCTSFPPFSGHTSIPILCAVWLCTQERWNPKVDIIFGAAARFRRATYGSSHYDAHPDNSALHTGAVLPQPALLRTSCLYRPVRAMAVLRCSKCYQLFRAFRGRALFVRGMAHPYFSVDPPRQRGR